MKKLKNEFLNLSIILSIAFTTFSTISVQAQDFGADLVSSYVWRGTQFGSGAHIQPHMELNYGSLTGGVWGSFPTTANGGGNELDLYLSYSFRNNKTQKKYFELTLTNYSFPKDDGIYNSGEGLFEKDYLEVAGSGKFGPINLMVGYFTELEALYVEAAFLVGAVDIGVGFGSDSKDKFYAGGDSGLVNLSFGGSKEIKITEEYSLPLSGSFIYNPDSEAAFLVFGMNF